MLPVYASYFAGGGERSRKKTLFGALGHADLATGIEHIK